MARRRPPTRSSGAATQARRTPSRSSIPVPPAARSWPAASARRASTTASRRSASRRCGRPTDRPAPGHLGADVDLRRLAEPEAVGPALQRMAAVGGQVVEAVAELVEVRVARLRERRRQVIHWSISGVQLWNVCRTPCSRASRAAARTASRALLHRRERGHGLERRARRVRRVDRAVDARVVVASRPPSGRAAARASSGPCGRRRSTAGSRVRRHRQHRAVLRAQRDDRAAVRVRASSSRRARAGCRRRARARPPAAGRCRSSAAAPRRASEFASAVKSPFGRPRESTVSCARRPCRAGRCRRSPRCRPGRSSRSAGSRASSSPCTRSAEIWPT